MKIKLRHEKTVCCPYLDNTVCTHATRCIRMRNQECKYYHMDEALMKAQITVIIAPRNTGKLKYLRRISHGKNKS